MNLDEIQKVQKSYLDVDHFPESVEIRSMSSFLSSSVLKKSDSFLLHAKRTFVHNRLLSGIKGEWKKMLPVKGQQQ